jgi:hypothetical protein
MSCLRRCPCWNICCFIHACGQKAPFHSWRFLSVTACMHTQNAKTRWFQSICARRRYMFRGRAMFSSETPRMFSFRLIRLTDRRDESLIRRGLGFFLEKQNRTASWRSLASFRVRTYVHTGACQDTYSPIIYPLLKQHDRRAAVPCLSV